MPLPPLRCGHNLTIVIPQQEPVTPRHVCVDSNYLLDSPRCTDGHPYTPSHHLDCAFTRSELDILASYVVELAPNCVCAAVAPVLDADDQLVLLVTSNEQITCRDVRALLAIKATVVARSRTGAVVKPKNVSIINPARPVHAELNLLAHIRRQKIRPQNGAPYHMIGCDKRCCLYCALVIYAIAPTRIIPIRGLDLGPFVEGVSMRGNHYGVPIGTWKLPENTLTEEEKEHVKGTAQHLLKNIADGTSSYSASGDFTRHGNAPLVHPPETWAELEGKSRDGQISILDGKIKDLRACIENTELNAKAARDKADADAALGVTGKELGLMKSKAAQIEKSLTGLKKQLETSAAKLNELRAPLPGAKMSLRVALSEFITLIR